jgi:PAS domain S-box-containing protein
VEQGATSEISPDFCAPAWDESERLAALDRYGILDSERDVVFDRIADLASAMLDTPIAVVNFIAADRQWFKAEIGIGTDELPLDVSICRYAILQPGVFVVPDLSHDPRFANNPLVATVDGLRFYAGALLVTTDGLPVGTICVLDTKPRPFGISERQKHGLETLAAQTMDALDRHAAARQQQYFLALGEALHSTLDPQEVMKIATRSLGSYLGVARVGFGYVDDIGKTLTIAEDWSDGTLAPIADTLLLDDFGYVGEKIRTGEITAVGDVKNHPEIDDTAQAAYAGLGVRATLVFPLVRKDHAVATFYLHSAKPRHWGDDEIALVGETAALLWTAVEQRRAEMAMRSRSLELEALIENSPIGFAYFDAQHRYRRINAELASTNGLSVNAHIGHRIEDLLPQNAQTVVPLLDQVFATGETIRAFEVVGETPREPGVTRYWLSSYYPVMNGDSIVAVGAWVIDITERRLQEESQRESEAMLHQAQELGGVGSWAWDHAKGEGIVSPSYRHLHDLPESDRPIRSEDLLAIMHPDDRETFKSAVALGLKTGERITIEYRLTRADGSTRWIRGIGQRHEDDLLKTSGIAEDVTDTRSQIDAVIQSEAKFRSVYEQAAVGIARVALDGKFVDVNDRFATIAGHERSLVGKTFQSITHPDDLALDLRNVNQLLAGSISSYTMEKRYVTEAGGTVWVNLAVGLVRTVGGEPEYFVAVIEDISERKRAQDAIADREAQIRRLNADLERRVSERTHQLTKANTDLAAEIERRESVQARLVQSKKLEALGQMTSGLAHDFNNIVAAIASGFTMIADWSDDPRVLEVAEHGIEAGKRGGALVKQLMAFARQQKLDLRTVDIATVIDGAMPLIRRSVPSVDVSLHMEAQLPLVRTDPVQVEAALVNFAVNARDAMSDGGRLRIEVRHCEADDLSLPSDLRTTPCVAISVTDTGHGMSATVLERVMEPFFTTKEIGKGTGLGLATAQGFATQSGGGLTIESAESVGTTVTLFLPCAHDVAVELHEQSVSDSDNPIVGTILLVDDDNAVRTMTAFQLTDLGAVVLQADSATRAIELLTTSNEIDAVITDIVMPVRDGHALAIDIRAAYPALPIMFLSGNADQSRLEGELVLAKPFTREELQSAVRTLLQGKSVRQ